MKSNVCAFILNDSFLSFSQFVINTTDLESDFESQNFGSNGAHYFRLVSHYATRMSIALRASLLEITRIREKVCKETVVLRQWKSVTG